MNDSPTKQLRRPHYIKAWMDRAGLSAADLSREIVADKSVVSRWLAGSSPSVDYQIKLAVLFKCQRESLFRHPDEAWLASFLQGRSNDEISRVKAMLEAAFPKH